MLNNLDVLKDETILVKEDINLNLKKNSNLVIDVKDDVNILNILENSFEGNITINVYAKASVVFNHININQENVSFNIEINLLEENAKAYFNNISVAKKNEHNYNVKINNKAINTHGNIYQKAVCIKEGKISLKATGKINKDCSLSSNYQESRVLLLDKASYGEATPMLLIDNHDVLAGHKASVSKVDEADLYYLQTRGIKKEVAESLLTYAFVGPVVDKLEDGELILKRIKNELEI